MIPAGPTLIDRPVHLTSLAMIGGCTGLKYTDSFRQAVGTANPKKTLEAGFTAVRNVGSADFDDMGLRQAIDSGWIAVRGYGEVGDNPAPGDPRGDDRAAEALDKSEDVGQIAVGRYGDIVAVDGDPLGDMRLLQHPAAGSKGGRQVP